MVRELGLNVSQTEIRFRGSKTIFKFSSAETKIYWHFNIYEQDKLKALAIFGNSGWAVKTIYKKLVRGILNRIPLDPWFK